VQELGQEFVEILDVVGVVLVIQLAQFCLFHEVLMVALQEKVKFFVSNFATEA
jgi:hypothetical protein